MTLSNNIYVLLQLLVKQKKEDQKPEDLVLAPATYHPLGQA